MGAQIRALPPLLPPSTRIPVTALQASITAVTVGLGPIASRTVHTSVLTRAPSYWLDEAQVNPNDNRQGNNNKNGNRGNNGGNRGGGGKIKRQKSHSFTPSTESDSPSLSEPENALFRIHSARRVHRPHNDPDFWMTTVLTITCIMKRTCFMTSGH